MIDILGVQEGQEFEAAQHLRKLVLKRWPDLAQSKDDVIKIFVGLKMYGYKIEDLDLIIIGHFSEPRAFDVEYRFSPRNGAAFVPRKAFVRNFALVIEEKSHSPTGVRFEGTSASVRYIRHGKVEWDNVTEKNHRQLFAFKQYLADRGVSALHVHHLIMFTGLRESQLPARPHNMFGSDASFERILNILGQIAGPLRNGTRADIAFGADAVFDTLTAPDFPMFQEMLPTPLDRRRMDLIAKNAAPETWLKGLGEQHMLLKGRGGVGKTVVLLQLAYRAFDKNQSRSLVLTFNKALVADLRRTMALMGIPRSLENGGIGIETVHGFIGRLMLQLGIIDGYDEFLDRYEENKATLLHYLTSGTVSTADLDDLKSAHGDDFGWDLLFVDEGQDWPQDEIAILRYLYAPRQITISDGIDQFVRESVADWTSGVEKRSVEVRELTRCMRMKANIAAVVRDVAAELGIENWDLEPNLEATGGRVLVVEGDLAARPDLLQMWADEAKELGNYPVDLLACVPPIMVDQKREEFCQPAAAYAQTGGSVWDGTSADIRQTYPSRREQLRFVQYDSCRGLEGWSVFAYGLDELWNYKVSQRLAEDHEIDPLITSREDDAHQHAARWIMIPLTRAMDTLVINFGAGESMIKTALRVVADKRPDCIEWISVGD